MSEAPTNPVSLAAAVEQGEVREFMTAGVGRDETLLDGELRPVSPQIRMPRNDMIGVRAQATTARRPAAMDAKDQRYLKIWFSALNEHPAGVVESVIRSLRWFKHPIVVTCSGNRQGISYRLMVHKSEVVALRNLLMGVFPHDQIEDEEAGGLRVDQILKKFAGQNVAFRGIVPPSPPWGSLTSTGKEQVSFYPGMAALPDDAFAVYQVILQAMPEDSSAIIRLMLKAEEFVGRRSVEQHDGWIPSASAVRDAESKLSGPLFGAVLRVAVFAKTRTSAEATASSLLLPLAGLHFTGTPIDLFTQNDLMRKGVGCEAIVRSLLNGTTYQSGMVVSSSEAALLIPLPGEDAIKNESCPLDRVSALTGTQNPGSGIVIAQQRVFGKVVPVIWPDSERPMHLMATGSSGFGKTLFVSQLCAEIANAPPNERNEGFAIIDPHFKAIVESCCRLAERRLDDVILFDATDRDYVFCMPLLDCQDPVEVDTAVSNISHQFMALFARADMGFNIERGLRNGIRTILMCPELSLLDARHLFSHTRKGEQCREEACAKIDDEMLVDYWENEFKSLDGASLGRIRGRFEFVLEIKRLRPLLANKIRKISYSEIVNSQKLMMIHTSAGGGGVDIPNILGTLHLTGLMTAGHARPGIEGQRSVFSIVADEFGNYSNPHTISHSLRTLRRNDVSIVFATQNIYALPEDVREATGNVDTHIVFQQSWDDAQHYFKTFCGMVPATAFMHKAPGEGYAKIGRSFATITCPLSPRVRDPEILEEIRARTRRRYCVTMKEFQERMVEEHHVSLKDMKDLDLI